MKNSMKLSIRSSEIRERLNAIAGMDAGDVTEDIKTEADGLRTELGAVETQYRAALAGEEEAEKRAAKEFADGDGEAAEVRALRDKVHLGNYMLAAADDRSLDGAERELNDALKLKSGKFPISLLVPELRATTDAEATATQSTWVDRLFANSAARRLGITFQSAPPGVRTVPVTTAGAASAQRGRSQAAADAAWTVATTELKATRNTVRAVYSEEDDLRLPGLEAALRRDLSMSLMEGIDRAVFIGDSSANENRADIAGLTTASGVTEQTITQANKILGPGTLEAFSNMVDGIHAASFADLNVVSAVGAWRLWENTIFNSAADSMTLAAFLRGAGLSWTSRGDIETATSNGDFGAFVGLSRGIEGAGMVAVFDEGSFVRDPYSKAAEGEVALTLSYYWDFKLPRASSFQRVKFVT